MALVGCGAAKSAPAARFSQRHPSVTGPPPRLAPRGYSSQPRHSRHRRSRRFRRSLRRDSPAGPTASSALMGPRRPGRHLQRLQRPLADQCPPGGYRSLLPVPLVLCRPQPGRLLAPASMHAGALMTWFDANGTANPLRVVATRDFVRNCGPAPLPNRRRRAVPDLPYRRWQPRPNPRRGARLTVGHVGRGEAATEASVGSGSRTP